MLKEIGGYFEIEQLNGDGEYHTGCFSLNTASNALVYYIKCNNINKIYIPFYLCHSVEKKLIDYHVDYDCYHIDDDFMPLLDVQCKDDEYVYIVNYYGLLDDKQIIDLNNRYGNIIIDNVHAFFKKPVADICTIYSCRKFFGVPDGAYLYGKIEKQLFLEKDDSANRFRHLYGRRDVSASEYYQDYLKNENNLSDIEIKKMSSQTKNIMSKIDYEKALKKRNNNFRYLSYRLSNLNMINLENIDGAISYPLYIDDADHIRRKLIDNKIYIPTYWKDAYEECDTYEKKLISNILPLPCDHRYCEDDMRKIADIIDNERAR